MKNYMDFNEEKKENRNLLEIKSLSVLSLNVIIIIIIVR